MTGAHTVIPYACDKNPIQENVSTMVRGSLRYLPFWIISTVSKESWIETTALFVRTIQGYTIFHGVHEISVKKNGPLFMEEDLPAVLQQLSAGQLSPIVILQAIFKVIG